MGNRCSEGSLDKNNLPHSLNDNTHKHCYVTRRSRRRPVCACLFIGESHDIGFCESLYRVCGRISKRCLLVHNVSCCSLWWLTGFTNFFLPEIPSWLFFFLFHFRSMSLFEALYSVFGHWVMCTNAALAQSKRSKSWVWNDWNTLDERWRCRSGAMALAC